MRRSRVSRQTVTFLTAIALLGLAPVPSRSNDMGGPRSIVRQIEQQFPALASQMQARSQFNTTEDSLTGQARHVVTPVGDDPDAAGPAGLQAEEAAAWLAAAKPIGPERRNRLRLDYPGRYDEMMVAEANGVRAELRALRANPAPVEIDDGKVVYRGVYPATDSVQVYREGENEEFLLLRDERAPVGFEYELSVSEGAHVSLDDRGEVRLVDAQQQGLVIPRPWIVDAKGERREDVVRWALSEEWAGVRKLVLELNPSGSSYPIVIDPGWRTTGSLHTARTSHTATLLPSGKVLVVGGWLNSGVILSTAEVWDPATGAWTYTGNLNLRRCGHTATLLANGKVLVAGGFIDSTLISNDFYSLGSAELYDPSTGVWTYTSSMNATRGLHTATLLSNGKVLVAGGCWDAFLNTDGIRDSVDLYDPATGIWTITGALNEQRYSHTATSLSNGRVLVTGGRNDSFLTYLNSVELYNPVTGVWTVMDPLPQARIQHTATLLQNGKVLVVGGFNDIGGGLHYLNSAVLYTPATGAWTPTGFLNQARCGQTATLMPNGQVLVSGGYNLNLGRLRSAELYDPVTGLWAVTANLNISRSGHTATLLPDGKVLLAGDGTSVEFYDPTFCPICKVLTDGERH